MNKMLKKFLLLLIITSGIMASIYLLYNQHEYIPEPKIIKASIKTTNPYYIQLDFADHHKKIIFKNVSWSEIKVLSGEGHVDVDRRDFPEEFTIDLINLKGDYNLKYKDINFVINSQGVNINNKLMDDNSVIIDNNGVFYWGYFKNYWEIPNDRPNEYPIDKN